MAGKYWVKEGNEGVLPQWERYIGNISMGFYLNDRGPYAESTGRKKEKEGLTSMAGTHRESKNRILPQWHGSLE